MQCGAPVIAGNRTSIPEIAGDAALLFDPFDTEAVREALARVIDDARLRTSLRQRGLDRANEFNWTKTAQLTLQTYREVAKEDAVAGSRPY